MGSVLGWGTKVLHAKSQTKANKQKLPQINRQNEEMKEGTSYYRPQSDVRSVLSDSLRPHGQRSLAGYSSDSGMEPALAGGFFTTEPPGKPCGCPRKSSR